MIPNELIEQILDRVDIVEVITGYAPLKKAGQNFKACCPFHKEKTPSFMVNPSKQIFHCFGCGIGGNVISFLMKYEKLDFIETIKILADKASITLPKLSAGDMAKSSLAERLFHANNLACNFYEGNLTNEYGKDAYRYLIQRGVDEATIKLFRLGFAQNSWQSLINYCKSKGIDLDTLETAGLIIRGADSQEGYDRFRNRIIFPIFDLRNRVLGFGGRPLDDSLPKYINSPETHIYRKGHHLYGLNLSKEYVRRQNYVIIVEGYFDLILPFQNEIKNIVATLGTALTVEQIDVLKRFTKNVIMIYDSDKAGEAATLRGLDLLIEQDMNVRIAILPEGKDPDTFVRKEGKEGFTEILKESKDLFDYKLGTLTLKFKKDEPRGKTRIVGEMLPTLAKIKNAVLKSSYLKKISEELLIDEDAIRAELKKVKPEFTRPYSLNTELEERRCKNLAEMILLALVLEDTKFIEDIDKSGYIGKFKDERINAILEKIRQLEKSGKKVTPSHLISHFEDGKIEEIVSEAVGMSSTIQNKDKILIDCLKHIKRNSLKEALCNIQSEIKQAEVDSDHDRVNKLIAKYNELIKGYKEALSCKL